jgi:hypothetical protein
MGNLFNKMIEGKQFNFQAIEFGEQSGYHVDVKDEHNMRREFRMLHENDRWQIEGEELPPWIYDNLHALIEAINEHE